MLLLAGLFPPPDLFCCEILLSNLFWDCWMKARPSILPNMIMSNSWWQGPWLELTQKREGKDRTTIINNNNYILWTRFAEGLEKLLSLSQICSIIHLFKKSLPHHVFLSLPHHKEIWFHNFSSEKLALWEFVCLLLSMAWVSSISSEERGQRITNEWPGRSRIFFFGNLLVNLLKALGMDR